jgi:hypothetical protein
MAMHVRLRKSLAAASLFALVAASSALAQSWVDPPATAENISGASGQASVAASEPKLAPPAPLPTAEPAAPPKAQAAQQPAEAPRETLRFDAPRETAPNRVAPPSRTAAPANAEPKATAPRRPAQSGASAPPETPPTRSVRRPRPAPAPEPALAARPQGRERQTGSMAGAAQQLAIDYLGYWSGPNAVAVGSTPDFYASRVLFHGRSMSARALAEEKRRFVQRWPQRYYTPRLETMRTSCDPARDVCTVRTVFDFTALNPAQGARSRGTADLELGVSFSGGHPVIAFESSHVLRRGRSARSASLDDAE